MNPPTKKSSPFPIARATDQDLEPRPLSPVRRYAAPIGVAAALLLAGAGAAASVALSDDGGDDRRRSNDHRRHTAEADIKELEEALADVKSFFSPPVKTAEPAVARPDPPLTVPTTAPTTAPTMDPEPPMRLGGAAPPISTAGAAPPPTPTPHPPRLAGKPMAPAPHPPRRPGMMAPPAKP